MIGKTGVCAAMVTLKDVARRAGVSIVTVHKCIYGKPGVGEDTRKRVLDLVEQMHYTVGPATGLARVRRLNMAVLCPDMPGGQNSFFLAMQQGVERAARELSALGVQVRLYKSPMDWKAQAAILEELAGREDFHGVAVYCADESGLNPSFDALNRRGVPIVTFNSDAPRSCRLACVTAPALRMGELAAELLCKMERGHRRLLIVGGDKRLDILRNNTTGFYSYIQRHHPEISLLEINNAGHRDLAGELTKMLTSLDDITGVYCSMTRNGLPVCQALQKLGLGQKLRLVCTDVFPDLLPYLRDGTVDATIWQNPQAQSQNAVLLLHHYLTTGKLRQECFQIPINPVMDSNFEYFL